MSLLLLGAVGPAAGGSDAPEVMNGWSPLTRIYSGPAPTTDDGLPNCPLQRQPTTVTRADGSVVVVWWDKFKGDVNQLVWTQRAAGSSTWAKPQVVHRDAIAYWQYNTVKLVAIPDRSVIALWENNQPLQAQREFLMSTLPAGAHEWSEPQRAPADWNSSIRFASGADGALHAVWTGRQPDGHGDTPYYSRRASDGTWPPPTRLRMQPARGVWVNYYGGPSRTNYTSGVDPSVAVRSDGAVLATWLDDENTLTEVGTPGHDLRYRIRDPAIGAWSGERGFERSDDHSATSRRREGLIGLNQGVSQLAAATSDGFHVIYLAADGGLLWTSLPRGAQEWTPPQRVFAGNWKIFDPTLHVGKTGELISTARGFVDRKDMLLAAELPAKTSSWRLLLQTPVEFVDHTAGINASGAPFILIENNSRVSGCLTLDITEQGPQTHQ